MGLGIVPEGLCAYITGLYLINLYRIQLFKQMTQIAHSR